MIFSYLIDIDIEGLKINTTNFEKKLVKIFDVRFDANPQLKISPNTALELNYLIFSPVSVRFRHPRLKLIGITDKFAANLSLVQNLT